MKTVFALVLLAMPLSPLEAPRSVDPSKCVSVGWHESKVDCPETYEEYRDREGKDPGVRWELVDPTTWNAAAPGTTRVECYKADGTVGWYWQVLRNGQPFGEVCVSAADTEQRISTRAIKAFKEYDWPGSSLSVEPPGGRTLVNLSTFYFTDNTATQTLQLKLEGVQVAIEATPVEYTWHFGDGESVTTASPGGPHPDGDVTHTYASTGTVEARVDTTYAGRYRIRQGDWVDIPETLTVPGEGLTLTIVAARPELVRN